MKTSMLIQSYDIRLLCRRIERCYMPLLSRFVCKRPSVTWRNLCVDFLRSRCFIGVRLGDNLEHPVSRPVRTEFLDIGKESSRCQICASEKNAGGVASNRPKPIIPRTLSNYLSACWFLAVVLSLSSAIAFDVVGKKSDSKKLSGTITAMTKVDVTIKGNKGEETVPLNDIDVIEWDGGGGEMNLGYSDEKGGRYDQATQRFLKAKGNIKSPSKFLQAEFDYVLARVAAKQAFADPEKRDQAIQKLIVAQKGFPDHVRFYESVLLLTQLQLSAKDFEGARKTLDVLKLSPANDVKLKALIAEARVLAAEGKNEESMATFSAVLQSAGNNPSESVLKTEAQIGLIRAMIQRTNFEEALQILESITEKPGPVEDPTTEAEAFVLQGQALRGLGRNKEAILAYLYVDINFPKETECHAESLFHLVNLWKLDQHPDRSAEASGKLIQLYPKSEWRKKLTGTE